MDYWKAQRDPGNASQLWLLCDGRTRCVVQTLTGHTSAVEAVRLDTAEEKVVTGSRSGTLKVWDLEQQKGNY